MYQNYNYYPQSYQSQPGYMKQVANTPQPVVGLKGRPVASFEEARATSVDFDGSIFYFPDLANKKIYTKQILPDGTAQLNLYEMKMIPMEQIGAEKDYVTRSEFESALASLKAILTQEPPQESQKEVLKTF